MPALSSFISYRPRRSKKASISGPIQVSSPFHLPSDYPGFGAQSPHPYASPRVLDINNNAQDHALPPLPSASPGGPYYNTASTPRVQLNMDLNPEPLTDWFPTGFLRGNESFVIDKTNEASGSGSRIDVNDKEEKRSSEGDEESSVDDDVLADLEAMDASNFVQQPSWKRPAPTPIKIPNAALHGPKVQLVHSSSLSRPISQTSSPESSAISGTTLARALMANTFVLSSDTRQSRYRSGGSTLTRMDSATLPKSEYSIHSPYWRASIASGEFSLSPMSEDVPPVPGNAEQVYVPPQTQRDNSGGDNKDKRKEDEVGTRTTPIKAIESPPTEQSPPLPPSSERTTAKSQRYSMRPDIDVVSSNTDNSTKNPSTLNRNPTATSVSSLSSDSFSSPPTSAKDLDNVLDYYSFADDVLSPSMSSSFSPESQQGFMGFRLPFSPITEESSSQLSPPTPFNRRDSIVSSTSSRLNGSGSSKRISPLPPGRFFLNGASAGGARVDWNVRPSGRRDSNASNGSTNKPLLPFGDRTSRSTPSISSIPESVTNSILSTSTHNNITSPILPPLPPPPSQLPPLPPSSSSSMAATSTPNSAPISQLAPPSTVFSRLRAGSAPAPIKVVRDLQDPKAYNITVTPRSSGSNGSNDDGFDAIVARAAVEVGRGEGGAGRVQEIGEEEREMSVEEMEQTFPETPSAFSPGFSIASPPGGNLRFNAMSPGSTDYLSMTMPQTPMTAPFLPPPLTRTASVLVGSGSGGNASAGASGNAGSGQQGQPSMTQVMLMRAATSVHMGRHSRQASLGKAREAMMMMKEEGEKEKEKEKEKDGPNNGDGKEQLNTVFEVVGDSEVSTNEENPSQTQNTPRGPTSLPGTERLVPKSLPGTERLVPKSLPGSERSTPKLVPGSERSAPKSLPESERVTPKPLPASERLLPKSLPPEVALTPPPAPPRSISPPIIPSEQPSLLHPSPRSPHFHDTPSPPTAPVLGTVSLPQVTPSPPTFPLPVPEPTTPLPPTPNSANSEEAVLAYDMDVSEPNSRAPSRADYSSRTGHGRSRSQSRNEGEGGVSGTGNGNGAVMGWGLAGLPRGGGGPSAQPHVQAPPPLKDPGSMHSTPTGGNPATPLSAHPLSTPVVHRTDPLDISSPASATPISTPISPSRRPGMINPPPPHIPVPPAQTSASSLYSLSYDSGVSPPPYDAVMNTYRSLADAATPSTSGSYDPNYRFGQPGPYQNQPGSPLPNTTVTNTTAAAANNNNVNGTNETGMRQGTQSMIVGPRRRTRPPLPAGPRRPSAQHGPAGVMRERGGSVSSVNSQQPSSLPTSTSRLPPRQPSAPLPSPKFETPGPKWRGYTMDAAKWTFTSTQLQGIVSRAIRQSSEPSSIRLLQLQTLDEEIPEEVTRLESVRRDAKTRYKTLARRRAGLLDALIGGVDSPQDPETMFGRLEELKELCGLLDKTTEELHSVDEQLSQLAQLTQGHSTSALAMALRKLNASFLKQFAEAQNLRQQVESLQEERDEAWNQVAEVANEYEDLKSGKIIESPDAENRFEKLMAIRKSSIRAAKAGLRSANSMRSIHRASTGSRGTNTPSSARTTYIDIDPPPVPPIPKRRPVDIKTNLPLRSSAVTGVSTDFSTPNSETRAMVRAQDELYDMLGIPVNERSRRSRSVIGLPGDTEPIASPSYSHFDVPPNTGRRASLPPSAPLPADPYALTADASMIWTSDRAGWI